MESRAAGALTPWAVKDQIVVGSIPRQPAGFQPRPSLLAQLNRTDRRVSVLTGLPGVGKTQLAAMYARAKLIAGWRLVAWVNADDPATLLAGLTAVADASRRSDSSSGPVAVDAGQAVRHRLEADGERCLLVLDGVENPDVLSSVVPAAGPARVLVTSSRQSAANLGTTVAVDVFSPDEALAVLAQGTELVDEDGAAALAAEVGYLPMALAQAASVIGQLRLGYGEYLEQLRAQPVGGGTTRKPGQPDPADVPKAVTLSVEAVRASDQTGVYAGVLEIMAVLSTCGVRREMLHAAGQAGLLARGGLRVPADLVDQALEGLADRSLLTPSLDGYTVIAHHLVMRVVRDGLARQKRYATACRAAASVLEAHAEALAGSPDRPAVRDIPQQVTTLLDNAAGSVAEADRELLRVLLRLRLLALYHLVELGDSATQAITVGEPLIAELDRLLGPDHPDTLNARNSLATAYQAVSRPADAVLLLEQTLVGRERLLGPDHPHTLTAQHKLAAAYEDAGRLAEAISLYQMTLAGRERVLGTGHPNTLDSRGNLAAAYRRADQVATAIPLFEQTLADRERLLGPDHRDTVHSRTDLAVAFRAAGRPAEAIPLVEQALATRQRLCGADHPTTLASRNNLAMTYLAAGRPAEAIPLFEQNLAACERLLGPDHPRTRSTRQGLAAARHNAGHVEPEGPAP